MNLSIGIYLKILTSISVLSTEDENFLLLLLLFK